MSIALLHRIARRRRFPVVLTDDADMEALRVLILAGHVKAVMQVTLDPLGGGPQPGMVVSEITALGRLALAHWRPGEGD